MIQAPSKKYVLCLEVPVENLTLMDIIQGQNNLGMENIKYGNAKPFTDMTVYYLPQQKYLLSWYFTIKGKTGKVFAFSELKYLNIYKTMNVSHS